MTQVTKSTMIGELLQIDENIAPILLNIGMHYLVCRLLLENALSRMPIFPDGDHRRGRYGSWN